MIFIKSQQPRPMQYSSYIFFLPALPITKAQSPPYPHKNKQIKYVQFLKLQEYLHFCTAHCLNVEVARQSFISLEIHQARSTGLTLGHTKKFHAIKLPLTRRQKKKKKDRYVWGRVCFSTSVISYSTIVWRQGKLKEINPPFFQDQLFSIHRFISESMDTLPV